MNTIKIGSQEWASEDLKVTKFRNGEDIPLVTDDEKWIKLKTAGYCITPKGSYLYNWHAVNDPRGLAPEGFHVPSDEEWTELVNYLGGEQVAGTKMKSSPSDIPAWDGTNSSGFSPLPGGYRNYFNGSFFNEGYLGYWWSSSANGADYAWYRNLDSDYDIVYRYDFYPRYGFSVRCVRDE